MGFPSGFKSIMAYNLFNSSLYQQMIYYKNNINSNSYFYYGNPYCTEQRVNLSELKNYTPMYIPKMKELTEIEIKSNLNPYAHSFFNFDKCGGESIE